MGFKTGFDTVMQTGSFKQAVGGTSKKSGLSELPIILLVTTTEDNRSGLASHSGQKEQEAPKFGFSGK